MTSTDVGDRDKTVLYRRLDVIIQLLLESGANASNTTRDKILRLLAFGLTASETAAILGKKPRYVTATIAQVRPRTRLGVGETHE